LAENRIEISVDAAIIVARFAINGCDTFFLVVSGEPDELQVWADVLVVVTKVLAHETHVIEV